MNTLHLITPHAKGAEVSHLQTLLKGHGWYHAAVDGEYGPYTAQAVHRAKFWLGYAHPNQIAGKILFGLLEGTRKQKRAMVELALKRKKLKPKPGKKTKGDALVAWEMTQVGVKESPFGSNNVKYNTAFYGHPVSGPAYAWCGVFQWSGCKHVGLNFRYPYVPAAVSDAKFGRNGLSLLHPSQLFPGAMVCYDWNKDGEADHIGCFKQWVKEGVQFQAVEGNTGEADKSNGGEVLAPTDRYVTEVQAFVKVLGILHPA